LSMIHKNLGGVVPMHASARPQAGSPRARRHACQRVAARWQLPLLHALESG
jgi:hypothetical protein